MLNDVTDDARVRQPYRDLFKFRGWRLLRADNGGFLLVDKAGKPVAMNSEMVKHLHQEGEIRSLVGQW